MSPSVVPLLPQHVPGNDIPRILHQVWVGSPPPTWVRRNWALWDEALPDWTIMRWTEDNSDQWPLSRLAAKRGLPHVVVLADLIRIEQVWKHGGVYADCDTIPLRSIDDMVGERPAWIGQGGWEPPADSTKEHHLNNALFGFPEHHPFLSEVWAQSMGSLDKKSAFHIAGPARFEKVHATHGEGIDLPHWTTFPDLPAKMKSRDREITQDDLRTAFPEARIIHTADKSWYGSNHSIHQTPTYIMAIPWMPERSERARELAEQTRGRIVWDEKRHAFHTWRKVLEAVGDGAGIILEDDVVLAENWRNRIEDVIAEHRDDVIQFFSMRKADLTVGSRYEPGRTFMMNQCYYLPAGAAKELLDYTEEWNHAGQEHPTGYDIAMAEWMKVSKRKYWLHVPSLVQHEPWTSQINTRRPRNRQSVTFA